MYMDTPSRSNPMCLQVDLILGHGKAFVKMVSIENIESWCLGREDSLKKVAHHRERL